MSTKRFVDELEYGHIKGVDTTTPVSMIPPGFLRDARNANLGEGGGLFKRDGFTEQLGSAWSTYTFRNGIEFQDASGTTEKIFAITDNLADARIVKDDSGTMIDIQTGMDADARPHFVHMEDRLFWFNGDSGNSPKVYEGISPREMGLEAPSTELVTTEGGAASGDLISGSYLVAYTYAILESTTKQIIAESQPSNVDTITLADPDNSINVPVVASTASVSGSRELVIRVYRTVAGGSVLFLEPGSDGIGGNSNATGTIALTTDDDSLLTVQLETGNSQLKEFVGYTEADYPVVARNRVFVASSERNEVRFSKIGQEGPLPESFPALNFSSVEGRLGLDDRVVGLGQISGVPIVLKQHSVGRLEEVGLPEYTRAEDAVTYVYREISDTVGAVSHDAQTQVFRELVWLGKDNIYATNGEVIRPIASQIQSTIKSFDFQKTYKAWKTSAINDTKNRRIYIAVLSGTTKQECDFILVGDYQTYPEFRWTFYSAGSDNSTHPGIKPGCFFKFTNTLDGSFEVYFGNNSDNGQYYKMNDGRADVIDGTEYGIYFKLTSRPYDMTQPMVTKLYKNIRVQAEAEDDTYSFRLCSIYDLGVEEEFCDTFTVQGVGNNWDEHNWADDPGGDDLIWAGPALKELVYNPHRKAKFMQLVIYQTDKDAPATMLGWGVSGSIFGGI